MLEFTMRWSPMLFVIEASAETILVEASSFGPYNGERPQARRISKDMRGLADGGVPLHSCGRDARGREGVA